MYEAWGNDLCQTSIDNCSLTALRITILVVAGNAAYILDREIDACVLDEYLLDKLSRKFLTNLDVGNLQEVTVLHPCIAGAHVVVLIED